MKFSLRVLLLLGSLFSLSCVNADNLDYLFPSKTVYFGLNMGGGSTEWKYLVDTVDPPGSSPTTPTSVSEGGPSWGVVFGYDLSKYFSIEAQYMRFADANINLTNTVYVTAAGNPIDNMISKTQAFSLSGKFFAQVGHTHLRAFAAVGVGVVKRTDPLVGYTNDGPQYQDPPWSNYTGENKSTSCVTPYLSSGLDYNFTRHWIIETGFQYYTGFGASQVTPVSSFIPFAWDAYGRLEYQL